MSTQEVTMLQGPRSLLVVNDRGRMRQVFTPFKVQCIEPLEQVPLHAVVFVEGVFMHKRHRLLYWINQRPYPYYHFRIQISW